MTEPAPTVFVVDDDPSVRRALGRLLKSAGLQVQLFASAEDFLHHSVPAGPACVILDVRMPGLSGPGLQRDLAERSVHLPIVFITGHGDVPTAVEAMKAGAVDFLPKPFEQGQLLAAVHRGLARHAHARQEEADAAALRQRAETLSAREREVLELIVTGLLNKQVGQRLGVTEKTIKAHRAQVMRKMRAHSLPELVRMAEKLGVSFPQL